MSAWDDIELFQGKPEELLQHFAEVEGATGHFASKGALLLAEELTGTGEFDPRAALFRGVSPDMLARIMAGIVEPSCALRAEIQFQTGGAVSWLSWTEKSGVWVNGITPVPGKSAKVSDPAVLELATERLNRLSGGAVAPRGVLGETPPGPVFRVVRGGDGDAGGALEVAGLGVSFRLSRPAARALHAALGRELGAEAGQVDVFVGRHRRHEAGAQAGAASC